MNNTIDKDRYSYDLVGFMLWWSEWIGGRVLSEREIDNITEKFVE